MEGSLSFEPQMLKELFEESITSHTTPKYVWNGMYILSTPLGCLSICFFFAQNTNKNQNHTLFGQLATT
jgi:hypothetical protein